MKSYFSANYRITNNTDDQPTHILKKKIADVDMGARNNGYLQYFSTENFFFNNSL